MISYNVVKKCRRCGCRLVVSKEFSRKNYCDLCQKKIDKENKEKN